MISGNYRQLRTSQEVEEILAKYGDAWKDERIPRLQYELAAKNEIQKYKEGAQCAPFDAFVKCLLKLPPSIDNPETKLLDVGASAGYYREILRTAGFKYSYTGLDFSPAFEKLAKELYPDIDFKVGDARALPYPDSSFDIVLSGCCIIHIKEYEKVIAETARVAKKYAIFHRTPIQLEQPTTFYVKEAYGIPCLEIHFQEKELFHLFQKYGLMCIFFYDVFFDPQTMYGHREYLVEKI